MSSGFEDLSPEGVAHPLAVPLDVVAVPDEVIGMPASYAERSRTPWDGLRAPARRLGNCVLALSLVATNLTGSSEANWDMVPSVYLPPSIQDFSALPLPDENRESCPEIPREAMQAARGLLAQPEDPEIAKLRGRPLADNGTEEDPLASLQREAAPYQLAAQKAGVTIYDSLPYEIPLHQDLFDTSRPPDGPTQLPFSEYQRLTASYLEQFGITLMMGDPHTEYAYQSHGPTPSQLETLTAKRNMYDLIRAFSRIPHEEVDLLGIKKVLLVADAKTPHIDAAAYVDLSGDHETIGIDVKDRVNSLGVSHEIAHVRDFVTCGGLEGMNNDPTYDRHNTGGEYDKEQAKTSYPAYKAAFEKLFGKVNRYRSQGDIAACQVQQHEITDFQHEHAAISLMSDYAGESIGEDKAEEGANIPLMGSYNSPQDPAMPSRIREKFMLLFGRIVAYAPHIAHYFKLVAYKSSGRTIVLPAPACDAPIPPSAPTHK